MNDTSACPERTIAEFVRAAQTRLGLRRLADRAAVEPTTIVRVSGGCIAVAAPALRRLLAESERALAQARPR
jgi:hypothetical protein